MNSITCETCKYFALRNKQRRCDWLRYFMPPPVRKDHFSDRLAPQIGNPVQTAEECPQYTYEGSK